MASKRVISKRQDSESLSVGGILQRTNNFLNAIYKRANRQLDQSSTIKDVIKAASEDDDIEQLKLDYKSQLKASSNLATMSENDKVSAIEDVKRLLKKQVNDKSANWISTYIKKNSDKEKSSGTN